MKPRRAVPLERLVDADPSFIHGSTYDATRLVTGISDTIQQVWFDCPIHEDCRCGVSFANPIGPAPAEEPRGWQRTGETFETLTLSPSIRVLGGPDGCEWHGFITDGRFVTRGDAR